MVKLADLYKGLEEDFGYVVDDSEKGDLTTEAERLSYDWVKKHYNHEFLFVTDYDAEKRAFYHMRDENGVPQGYDLIWRGVEITTGAQREHRYEVLKKQAEEKGLAEDVKFYLEFFQYGCPPHGGFGLGIDRLTYAAGGREHQGRGVPVPRPQPSDPVIVKILVKAPVLLAWEPFVISGLFPTYDYNKRTGILSGAQRKREGESNLANQEQKSICREIGARTGGDIYIGVVGPVRSGKSTFIKRFMEQLVLPAIGPAAARERARDELPQSAAGRTIMTTEPKFIPETAVPLQLEGGGECRVRLIDCVGYMVEGAMGHEENDKPRMVKSPWFDHEVPFDLAAETGTRKVICEHSTIGIVVTTDGSISEIPPGKLPARRKAGGGRAGSAGQTLCHPAQQYPPGCSGDKGSGCRAGTGIRTHGPAGELPGSAKR